jgi:hypothetical protein
VTNSDGGIHIDNATAACVISGNTVEASNWGIWAFNTLAPISITGNTVRNPNPGGVGIAVASGGSNLVTISQNLIDGGTTPAVGTWGILITDYRTWFDWPPDASVSAVVNNNIIRHWEEGVYLWKHSAGTTLAASGTGNSITDTLYAVYGDGTGSTAYNFTGNWWGSTDAAAIADLMVGNITEAPWLTSGVDQEPGTPGFQPAALDTTPPTVSITRDDANPTKATSVVFSVDFSEEVASVDATDFVRAITGTVSANATVTVGDAGDSDPTTFTVTVDTVAGTGTLGLDIAAGTNIVDLAGNALVQTPTTDEAYTIDNTAPSTALTFPAAGAIYNEAGWTDSITGTASDTGGGTVANVKVSVQGCIPVSARGYTPWARRPEPTARRCLRGRDQYRLQRSSWLN